jgi:poly(3-hydroxybutyrate) depolymerase
MTGVIVCYSTERTTRALCPKSRFKYLSPFSCFAVEKPLLCNNFLLALVSRFPNRISHIVSIMFQKDLLRFKVNFLSLLKCFFVFCVMANVSYVSYAQQTKQETPAGTKFWLYTPPAYTPSTPSPVLISLHGAGTIGDSLEMLLTSRDELPARIINLNRWPASRPFIVVTPQLKRDLSIPDHRDQLFSPEMVDELLEYVKLNWNVNVNQVYITGLSLGGASAWLYAAAHPEKIAAMVPISGVTDTTQACLVKNIPTWIFHGAADDLVPTIYSSGMARQMNFCNPRSYNAQLNLLHARRHEGWNEVYTGHNGYNIYDWLLKFTKGDLSNKTPYVNAGADLKMLSRPGPFSLYGEFFDVDGSIASTVWSQVSGPAVTMNDVNSRWLTLGNLGIGTYVFQLTATDDDGSQSTDQVTIEVLNSTPVGQVAITDLILSNGATNQNIGSLSEGYTIDPIALGTNQFNIAAIPTSSPSQSSVKLGVNGDQGTRITNSPGPYYIISRPTGAEPEWLVSSGTYRICATSYNARSGYGSPGVSLCYNINVNLAPGTKFFYSKSSSDISSINSWGMNADGTGVKPASFSAEKQIFIINNSVSSTNPLNITGSGSALWVRSGGTLTINNQLGVLNAAANANVIINTNQTVTMGSIDPASNIQFGVNSTSIPASQYGNLTLSGSGSTKTLSGATGISGALTIESGVTVNAGSAQITVGGDIVNNGTFTPGSSTFTLNGTGTQLITGALSFNHLQISKPSGNVSLEGTGSVTVNNILTLSSGHIISSDDNMLSLSSTGSINGGSSSAFVEGPVSKVLGINGTFTFPLGDVSAARYRPVMLASTSATDTWVAEYLANTPTQDGYSTSSFNSSTLTSVSQFEYWDVSRAGSASASLTLSFNTGSYNPPNIGDPADLRIAHWEGAQWDIPEGNGTVSQSGDNVSGTVTVTNVTSFSPHTLGIFDGPLPVEWLSFEGKRTGSSIELSWKTSMERNNERFEIERSDDGTNYNAIGVQQAKGNSSVIQRYSFIDAEVSNHRAYYYRIKQIDFDKQFDYSKVIFIPEAGDDNRRWIAYPNPVHGNESFKLELLDKSADPGRQLEMQLVSATGKILYFTKSDFETIKQDAEYLVKLLDAGVYFIQLSDGIYREQFRVVRYK